MLRSVRTQRYRLCSSAPLRRFTASVRPQLAQAAAARPESSAWTSDAELHEVFDMPTSSYASSLRAASSTGLFGQPSLTSPSAFLPLARRTTLRAKVIVNRMCAERPPPQSLEEAEIAFLTMVKNLDRLSDLLCGVIDLAELVRNVHPDQAWNEGANEAYEELCEYMNELNTHVGLYEGLKSLHSMLPSTTPSKSPALFAAFAVATPFLKDFEKSGIHLPSSSRAQFVTLSTSILQLGRKFLQNGSEPREPILMRAQQIEEAFGAPIARRLFDGKSEGWIDPCSYEGRVLARQHPDEDVRRRLYVGANASPQSHVEVLDELLRTRGELARLVGRDSWGDVALEDKMAKTPDNVMGFLDALNRHNKPLAAKDVQLLRKTKKLYGGGKGPIEAWDRDYYSDLSNDVASNLPDISPFFSVGACLSGLSKLFSRLYGIRFEVEEVAEGETWTRDVRKLKVIDEDEGRIGTVYCDLFGRSGKQPGAAHYTVRCSRRVDDDDVDGDFDGRLWAKIDGVQVSREEMRSLDVEPVLWNGRPGKHQEPIVVLVCGFGSETGAENGPAHLQWHEVETLFHEMGHCLHSMIGRTDYHNVSGTRCATDFVELPSILMEHFISSPSVLALFAKHPSTGHTLPPDIIDNLLAERQRLSALETSSQITMAALDHQYHTSRVLSPSFDSTSVLKEAHSEFHVIPHAAGTSWQTQFGHLFGYGATYYSYLFDRAIAARIFADKFAADPLSRERGEEFKKSVLMWGGGKEPWEMIADAVGNDEVARGGRHAMAEVGRWGIEDTPRGK